MRQLTVKEIIKVLPFEKETKEKLLNEYDGYEDDMKTEVINMCYGAFTELLQLFRNLKSEELMQEVSEGKRELSTSFRDEVEKAAWDEVENRLNGKQEDSDELAKIRQQLEHIISQTQQ